MNEWIRSAITYTVLSIALIFTGTVLVFVYENNLPTTISVEASMNAPVTAEIAHWTIEIQQEGKSSSEASRKLNASAKLVVAFLSNAGFEKKSISASEISTDLRMAPGHYVVSQTLDIVSREPVRVSTTKESLEKLSENGLMISTSGTRTRYFSIMHDTAAIQSTLIQAAKNNARIVAIDLGYSPEAINAMRVKSVEVTTPSQLESESIIYLAPYKVKITVELSD